MKKQITIALFIAILIGVYQTGCADGQGEQEGSGTKTMMQTTKFEDAQGDCPNGGVKIEVLVDGTVDDTQTQYICNGINGQVEQNGTNTSIQTTKFEDAQGDCANGGVKIEVLVDGTVDDTQTQYLCNGAQGLAGSSTKLQATPFEDAQGDCANGGVKIEVSVDGTVDDTQTQYLCNGAQGLAGSSTKIQATPFEDAQGDCTNGGVKIEVLVDGTVDSTQTQYICHGVNGHDGKDGQNSYQALVMTSNDVGTNCAHGGIRIDSGVDKNNNNTLETSEILSTRYICNGANGADGQNGQDGTNGTNGTNASIQTTLFVGAQGSCTNGGVKVEVLMDGVVQAGQTQYLCNGVNGADGQDGQNGADGQNGHNALVATSNETAGTNCAHGGIRIDSGVDKNNNNTLESTEIVSTRYVCNGANGADGQNGQDGTNGTNGTNASIQTTPFVGAQGSCTHGGVKVEVLMDGVVQAGQTQYLCNGANGADGQDGQNGADGQNGHNAFVATSNETAGTNCAHGGIRIDSGVDKNNNNTLETSEILSTRYVCNGANGADGQDGTNGTNGTNASIQTTPFVGAQGGCTNGGVKVEVLMDGVVQAGQTQYLCNGVNGADGQDGQNGADGQNGHNALVATSNENAGTNCAHGGIRIDSGVDKNNNNTLETSEILSTRYVCNGANGADGQNGQDGTNGTNASIQTTPFEGAQGSCTNGGVKVEVLMDGVVQTGQTQYICNGADAMECLSSSDCVDKLNEPYCNLLNHVCEPCPIEHHWNTLLSFCEEDDSEHCGSSYNNCIMSGTNAVSAVCESSKCRITLCNSGYHLSATEADNSCILNTGNACAEANSANAMDCDAYACDSTGVCKTSCDSALDCAEGYACSGGICMSLSSASIGGSVVFGHYKGAPIEWYIMSKDTTNRRVKLVSINILDSKPYHTENKSIMWSGSSIRSWLNGYGSNYASDNFISNAFTPEEQSRIPALAVEDDCVELLDSASYSASTPTFDVYHSSCSGGTSNDKVFLLSSSEAKSLGRGKNACTDMYSKINGSKGSWWLRSYRTNDSGTYKTRIFVYGSNFSQAAMYRCATYNNLIISSNSGVRPALWLKY